MPHPASSRACPTPPDAKVDSPRAPRKIRKPSAGRNWMVDSAASDSSPSSPICFLTRLYVPKESASVSAIQGSLP